MKKEECGFVLETFVTLVTLTTRYSFFSSRLERKLNSYPYPNQLKNIDKIAVPSLPIFYFARKYDFFVVVLHKKKCLPYKD